MDNLLKALEAEEKRWTDAFDRDMQTTYMDKAATVMQCILIVKEHMEPYITPPKSDPMPQTVEAWERLYGLSEQAMLRQKDEISRLKERINKKERS